MGEVSAVPCYIRQMRKLILVLVFAVTPLWAQMEGFSRQQALWPLNRRQIVTRGRKDLVRSTSDRIFGGVCAGIAHWLGWRPNTVRILYVLGSVLSAAFPGTIVYLYCGW